MYKIGNITFDCFVMAKNTTIIIDHNKVQIIIKLLKKARDTVEADHTFSIWILWIFYLRYLVTVLDKPDRVNKIYFYYEKLGEYLSYYT